jgi:hypothetical protein
LALAGRAIADAPSADPSDPLDDATDDPAGDFTDEDFADEPARTGFDAGAELTSDSLAATSGLIDVASLRDLEARHRRPSHWGQIDLAIAWRRIDRIDEPRREEILLVATWRH